MSRQGMWLRILVPFMVGSAVIDTKRQLKYYRTISTLLIRPHTKLALKSYTHDHMRMHHGLLGIGARAAGGQKMFMLCFGGDLIHYSIIKNILLTLSNSTRGHTISTYFPSPQLRGYDTAKLIFLQVGFPACTHQSLVSLYFQFHIFDMEAQIPQDQPAAVPPQPQIMARQSTDNTQISQVSQTQRTKRMLLSAHSEHKNPPDKGSFVISYNFDNSANANAVTRNIFIGWDEGSTAKPIKKLRHSQTTTALQSRSLIKKKMAPVVRVISEEDEKQNGLEETQRMWSRKKEEDRAASLSKTKNYVQPSIYTNICQLNNKQGQKLYSAGVKYHVPFHNKTEHTESKKDNPKRIVAKLMPVPNPIQTTARMERPAASVSSDKKQTDAKHRDLSMHANNRQRVKLPSFDNHADDKNHNQSLSKLSRSVQKPILTKGKVIESRKNPTVHPNYLSNLKRPEIQASLKKETIAHRKNQQKNKIFNKTSSDILFEKQEAQENQHGTDTMKLIEDLQKMQDQQSSETLLQPNTAQAKGIKNATSYNEKFRLQGRQVGEKQRRNQSQSRSKTPRQRKQAEDVAASKLNPSRKQHVNKVNEPSKIPQQRKQQKDLHPVVRNSLRSKVQKANTPSRKAQALKADEQVVSSNVTPMQSARTGKAEIPQSRRKPRQSARLNKDQQQQESSNEKNSPRVVHKNVKSSKHSQFKKQALKKVDGNSRRQSPRGNNTVHAPKNDQKERQIEKQRSPITEQMPIKKKQQHEQRTGSPKMVTPANQQPTINTTKLEDIAQPLRNNLTKQQQQTNNPAISNIYKQQQQQKDSIIQKKQPQDSNSPKKQCRSSLVQSNLTPNVNNSLQQPAKPKQAEQKGSAELQKLVKTVTKQKTSAVSLIIGEEQMTQIGKMVKQIQEHQLIDQKTQKSESLASLDEMVHAKEDCHEEQIKQKLSGQNVQSKLQQHASRQNKDKEGSSLIQKQSRQGHEQEPKIGQKKVQKKQGHASINTNKNGQKKEHVKKQVDKKEQVTGKTNSEQRKQNKQERIQAQKRQGPQLAQENSKEQNYNEEKIRQTSQQVEKINQRQPQQGNKAEPRAISNKNRQQGKKNQQAQKKSGQTKKQKQQNRPNSNQAVINKEKSRQSQQKIKSKTSQAFAQNKKVDNSKTKTTQVLQATKGTAIVQETAQLHPSPEENPMNFQNRRQTLSSFEDSTEQAQPAAQSSLPRQITRISKKSAESIKPRTPGSSQSRRINVKNYVSEGVQVGDSGDVNVINNVSIGTSAKKIEQNAADKNKAENISEQDGQDLVSFGNISCEPVVQVLPKDSFLQVQNNQKLNRTDLPQTQTFKQRMLNKNSLVRPKDRSQHNRAAILDYIYDDAKDLLSDAIAQYAKSEQLCPFDFPSQFAPQYSSHSLLHKAVQIILELDPWLLDRIVQPFSAIDGSNQIWLYCRGLWRNFSSRNVISAEAFLHEVLTKATRQEYQQLTLEHLGLEEILRMLTGLRIMQIKNKKKLSQELEYHLKKECLIKGISLDAGKPMYNITAVQTTIRQQKLIQIHKYDHEQPDSNYIWIKQQIFDKYFDYFLLICPREQSYWTSKQLSACDQGQTLVYTLDALYNSIGSLQFHAGFEVSCRMDLYREIKPKLLKFVGCLNEKHRPARSPQQANPNTCFNFNIKGRYYLLISLVGCPPSAPISLSLQSTQPIAIRYLESISHDTLANRTSEYVELQNKNAKEALRDMGVGGLAGGIREQFINYLLGQQ